MNIGDKLQEANKKIKKEIAIEEIKEKEAKTQKKSTGYALKAIKKHVKTLVENGALIKEDKLTIEIAIEKATKKYVEKEFGIK